ncbi:hypothetical protein JDV02_001467 [Purpureocillium takamizusanense]|uniref:Uncharacterized protein n=1 Tax=Purpureocillium takamizusanense TaxID=2060973 RepID=A0A9Q8V7V5_9HYPO|nr:uncharacterized protein JDV02_001467 [Purpureocillium takamizusanense]UNI14886.1 hypothetical protein JDV02_001467 [Purpureocillium takamizusanense]
MLTSLVFCGGHSSPRNGVCLLSVIEGITNRQPGDHKLTTSREALARSSHAVVVAASHHAGSAPVTICLGRRVDCPSASHFSLARETCGGTALPRSIAAHAPSRGRRLAVALLGRLQADHAAAAYGPLPPKFGWLSH